MSETTTKKRYPLIANHLAAVRICCGILNRKQTEDHAMATETLERIGAALDVMTEGLRKGGIANESAPLLALSLLRQCENIMSHGIRQGAP